MWRRVIAAENASSMQTSAAVARTTVRIKIGGLVAFVPVLGSDSDFDVLLPDGRNGLVVNTCESPGADCRDIRIPQHVAYIVGFDGDEESWFLDQDDIRVEAVNPTTGPQDNEVLEYLCRMTTVQPQASPIDPAWLSLKPPAGTMVGRLRLSGGRLELAGQQMPGPQKVRAIQGNQERAQEPVLKTNEVQYVIQAESVKFRTKKFSDPWPPIAETLAGGVFEILVRNTPVAGDPDSRNLEIGFHSDTHFYWYYDLATPPLLPATQRLVPMFGAAHGHGQIQPMHPGSPRCPMVLFGPANPKILVQQSLQE